MNPWHIDTFQLTIRLLLALVLGGMVGFEREKSSSAAGFRTHILVCLGSTLIMLLSAYGFSSFVNETSVRLDPARLAAQVISGIGFLGAGTILRHGLSITGLTTAASLWVVAAIGLAIGAGFYYPAVLTTWLVIMSLWVLSRVEKKWLREKHVYIVKVTAVNKPGVITAISRLLEEKGIVVLRLIAEEEFREDQNDIQITFSLKFPKQVKVMPSIDEIRQLSSVHGVSVE